MQINKIFGIKILFIFKITIKTAIKILFYKVFRIIFATSIFFNYFRVLVILFHYLNIYQG